MRRILENWLKISNCSPQKTWKRFIKYNFLNIINGLNKITFELLLLKKNKSWKGYSVADITETTLNLSEVWLEFIKDEGSIEAVIGELPTLRKYGHFGNTSLWKWIPSTKGPRNRCSVIKKFPKCPIIELVCELTHFDVADFSKWPAFPNCL